MKIGFATGVFYRLFNGELDGFSKENLKRLGFGNAIELHCRNKESIEYLANKVDKDLVKDFEVVSMHAPSFEYQNNQEHNQLFENIRKITQKFNLNNIVVHPDKVKDWTLFDSFLDLPFSIENLDERQAVFNTPQKLAKIFNKYDFKFTFDLQHAFVNDKTMKLAKEFHQAFRDRLTEYHISAYQEKILHVPLFKFDQDIIINSLENKEAPIIIESTFDKFGDQKKEIEYIKNKFK